MIRMRGTSLLRPAGFDELGLRRAISDRLLPFLVAAMAFLAALALSGWVGAAALANSWQAGVASTLTVQVPQPGDPAAQGGGTRVARVLATLRAAPDVAEARALTEDELANLLRPWLGTGADRLAIPLPAVIAVRLADNAGDIDPLARQLDALAPGTLTERHAGWMRRLSVLARSLQACAGLILLLVAAVAVTVVAVATRAGLGARREAIEIVHGLGATDFYIAGRFAVRATVLAAVGAGVGAVFALPVLLVLANLAAPLTGAAPHISLPAGLPPGLSAGLAAGLPIDLLTALPALVWLALPVLPLLAAAIGCITAQITVRRWLRRLP
jgi:cell division transport system permease protein